MTKLEEMTRAYCLGRRFGSRAAIEPAHPKHVEWWDTMQPDGRAFEMRCMIGALMVLRDLPDELFDKAENACSGIGDRGGLERGQLADEWSAVIDSILADG